MSGIYSYTQLSEPEFEKIAKTLAPVSIPIEQTPTWGKFDDALPERTFLGSFRYDDGERLVAIASATLYQQKGRNWIWIKRGPLYASEPNTQTVKKMCSTLKAQFSSVKGAPPLFIRLSSPTKTTPLLAPFEHTMYDETVVVDLTKTEDEILAGMSQSGRRGMRKAKKEELVVESFSGNKAVSLFEKHCYRVLKETAIRDHFGIHPLKMYITMLERLGESARLYVILHKKQIVAWAITTEYDQTVLYYYGGSDDKARDLHAPYLLHWQIIKDMKARNNKIYDFMGIAGKNYPSLAHVTTFKLKFSKDIVSVPPAYDLPLQPAKYRLLSLAIKAKRKLNR